MSGMDSRVAREDTKYGSDLDGHDWSEPEPDVETKERTRIRNHEIEVIYVTDPSEDMGYGREKYKAIIRYDDESGEPYVLNAIGYRWKGNYWRDTTDWDWRDLPGPVRQQVAAALPVESPAELDNGTRLIEEGGESRWHKYHKPQMDKMDGDEMWGVSCLRDALDPLESAAEAFGEGTKGERLAEKLVSTTQKVIRTTDNRLESGEKDK